MLYKACSVCFSKLVDRLWVRLTRQKSIRDRGERAKIAASSGPGRGEDRAPARGFLLSRCPLSYSLWVTEPPSLHRLWGVVGA